MALFYEEDAGSDLLRRKSLKEEVFELLHRRIVAGKYAPGEWLRQEEISTQLGVSQTPVREALDQLVSVGLAERVPYRGVRVSEFSPEEVADAYVMRRLLETTAARLAAEGFQPEKITSLVEIAQQTEDMITLDDMSNLRQLNKKFHSTIVEASGNQLLCKLYEMASNRFPDWRLYEYMFRHPELLETSLAKEFTDHTAIAKALNMHDPDLAIQHLSSHFRDLARELVEFLGISSDLLRLREEPIESFLNFSNQYEK